MASERALTKIQSEESVVFQKEVRLFTIEKEIKSNLDLILPFSLNL